MNNNKQTAVEWLIDQLRQLAHNQSTHLGMGDIRVTQGMLDDFEEQAKEMEKQQIKGSWLSAWKDSMLEPLEDKYYEPEAEQYYNEEYGKL